MINFDKSSDSLRDIIRQNLGLTPLDNKLIHLLISMQNAPKFTWEAQVILYFYFSKLNEGSTRIPLDADKLCNEWCNKWESRRTLKEDTSDTESIDKDSLLNVLHKGVKDILSGAYKDIICYSPSRLMCRFKMTDGDDSERSGLTGDNQRQEEETRDEAIQPMVIERDKDGLLYIYAIKYYEAKCLIQSQFNTVFRGSGLEAEKDKLKTLTSVLGSKTHALTEAQEKVILRGLNDNLIITGGPGTGKTTVICYLLWMLLKEHPDYCDHWNICLAAPSGKASDRMRESIVECLTHFDKDKMNQNEQREQYQKIFDKLSHLESHTLHHLLKYNPKDNRFTYNRSHRFSAHSIFIIDEASMIDIDLFAKFLEALPDDKSEYRLYILGDPDQLPSVDAGAVLGEVMASTPDFAVQLTESHRFKDSSEIGMLAKEISKKCANHKTFETSVHELKWEKERCYYYDLSSCRPLDKSKKEQRKAMENALKSLIGRWCDMFYSDLLELANRVDPTCVISKQVESLNKLWDVVERARILCAEKRGSTGIQPLNEMIRTQLLSKLDKSNPELHSKFFTGQMLMLTRNQEMLKLYNGDSGIVLGERDTGRKYLLLKKSSVEKATGVSVPYTLYPLYLLPEDALESAFAMTIHKAQGSGYDNIMMFLPECSGHPLLNNQIVYTGVTRTKNGSLTIVSNADAFAEACETVIERDTGIEIGM